MKTNPQLTDLWTLMFKLNVNLQMCYRCSIIKSFRLSWIFPMVKAMPHGELGLSIESTSHRLLRHAPPFYQPCPGHVFCSSFTSVSNWAWLTKPFPNCQTTPYPRQPLNDEIGFTRFIILPLLIYEILGCFLLTGWSLSHFTRHSEALSNVHAARNFPSKLCCHLMSGVTLGR